jgi:hypothetical protein
VIYRGKEFAAQNGFCNAGDTGYPGSVCKTSLPAGTSQSVAITQTTCNANPCVKATVQQTQPTYLAGVLGLKTVQIGAQAIAQVTTTQPTSCASNCGCMLQTETNPAGGVGLNMSNGVTVKLNTCGATVDAKGASALTVTGGAQLNTPALPANAPSVSVAGGVSVSGNGKINSQSSCSTNCSKNTGNTVADPYADRVMPTTGTPRTSPSSNWGNYTLNPGVYTGDFTMSNGSTFNLNPGVYIVNGGNFHIGSATVSCVTCLSDPSQGVTIVLTSGTATIDNGANATLNAPTTGPTAGIAFFGSRTASASNVNSLAGGYNMKITGALYFPTQNLSFSNGVTNTATCTQIIAGSISIVGGTTLNSTQCSQGVLPIAGAPSYSTTLIQ